MLNTILASFYERDIRKLIEEINLFRSEDDLWKTLGSVRNTAGNLALHIIGGLNHYIGHVLANTGYARNRDQEFAKKGVSAPEIKQELENLIPLIKNTLHNLTEAQMEELFPVNFDGGKNSVSYVLVQLLAHLNYHTGQVNYLRRVFES